MTVQDFLDTYQNSMLNRKPVNPLSSTNRAIKQPKLGIGNSQRSIATVPGYGSAVPEWLNSRKSGSLDRYMASKSERTTDIASDYANKAAGQVPVDKFGIVQDKSTDFSSYFNNQLGSIQNFGKSALATEEAKAQWQTLQGQAEMNAGYQLNWAPGASGKNVGAKAVSLAMTAAQNGVPYVWGGNSLTRGVDCSGLIQQVYKKLGIALPRTTYEQAKYGKVISTGALLPGDLVFYNTGGRDPNGIGSLSHVGIYIGNGRIIHAPGRGKNVMISSLTSPGQVARAVRPW
jgi:cell wall-associated NlpC family hydrolase